jgi:hypothetical protein
VAIIAQESCGLHSEFLIDIRHSFKYKQPHFWRTVTRQREKPRARRLPEWLMLEPRR